MDSRPLHSTLERPRTCPKLGGHLYGGASAVRVFKPGKYEFINEMVVSDFREVIFVAQCEQLFIRE